MSDISTTTSLTSAHSRLQWIICLIQNGYTRLVNLQHMGTVRTKMEYCAFLVKDFPVCLDCAVSLFVAVTANSEQGSVNHITGWTAKLYDSRVLFLTLSSVDCAPNDYPNTCNNKRVSASSRTAKSIWNEHCYRVGLFGTLFLLHYVMVNSPVVVHL